MNKLEWFTVYGLQFMLYSLWFTVCNGRCNKYSETAFAHLIEEKPLLQEYRKLSLMDMKPSLMNTNTDEGDDE